MKFQRAMLAVAIATTTMTLAAPVAMAGNYPDHAITMVVPSSPGGSTDIVARLVADQMSRDFGQSVVVENRPGASGNIGTERVAKARNDGYTLLMQYSGYHVGNPALFKHIRWKPSDFAPVALVMRAPHVIAVSGKLPVNSLKELIAYGKRNGKGLNYASAGNGSIQHIAGAMFGNMTGVPVTHIPYKGAGPVVPDLISGRVDMFITTPPSVIGQIKAGKIKGLAYAGPRRNPSMPNVPTTAEAGLPGYQVESWFALFAPAGTPKPVIEKLTNEVRKIAQSENYKKKISEQGGFAAYMDPAQLGKFVDSQLVTWAKVIHENHITTQ